MFDTALAMLVSWLFQLFCLALRQIWQHPLLTTLMCLLVGFIGQTDEQLRSELMQQLRMRWQRVATCFQLFGGGSKQGMKGSCSSSCFDYGLAQGPHTWSQSGSNQSPVNIDEQMVQRLAIHELLNWNHYDELPLSIVLENTGQTLLLRAEFRSNVPTLSGADLLASYTFVELCFHWGWSNSEGSEHTINNRKYPLEVQVLHRTGAAVPSKCTSSYDLLMIAYIYELSAHNPFLDPLMQNLKLVQQPGKCVRIPPFPLSYLVYPFRSGFYSYGGSLTTPPCYQGIEWFVFPESLAISDFQLRHFRQLLGGDGFTPISRNSRPVQPLGNRVVNLNYFCPYDVGQLERLQLKLQQKQQQEEEAQAQAEAAAEELQKELEKKTELEDQQANIISPTNDSEEVGQLVESLDSTTTIRTNLSTSVCTTLLPQKLASCCPNSIIFFSSANGNTNSKMSSGSISSNNNNSNINNINNISNINNNNNTDCNVSSDASSSQLDKSNNTGHFLLDQADNIILQQFSNETGSCGIGDNLNVGSRIQIE